MNFHGQDIIAHDEIRWAEREDIERVLNAGRRQRLIGDDGGRGGQVDAENFAPVQMHYGGVIALQHERQGRERQRIRDREAAAEVGGGVAVGVAGDVAGRAVVLDDGGLVAVAVAEFGEAVAPTAVVEGERNPVRALVGAVVEVAPVRVHGHEREGDAEVDGRGHVAVARIILAVRGEAVRAAGHVRPCCGERCGGVRAEKNSINEKVHVRDRAGDGRGEDAGGDGTRAAEDGAVRGRSEGEADVRDEHAHHGGGADLADAVAGHGVKRVGAGGRAADREAVGGRVRAAEQRRAAIKADVRDRAGGRYGGGVHGDGRADEEGRAHRRVRDRNEGRHGEGQLKRALHHGAAEAALTTDLNLIFCPCRGVEGHPAHIDQARRVVIPLHQRQAVHRSPGIDTEYGVNFAAEGVHRDRAIERRDPAPPQRGTPDDGRKSAAELEGRLALLRRRARVVRAHAGRRAKFDAAGEEVVRKRVHNVGHGADRREGGASERVRGHGAEGVLARARRAGRAGEGRVRVHANGDAVVEKFHAGDRDGEIHRRRGREHDRHADHGRLSVRRRGERDGQRVVQNRDDVGR